VVNHNQVRSEFYNEYDFNGLEPFTLLIIENDQLFELIVNQSSVRLRELDCKKPYMYSSSTLYGTAIMEDRILTFYQWYYKRENITQEDVLLFHQKFLYKDEKEKPENQTNNILNTVSITSVYKTSQMAQIHYFDLINDIHMRKSLVLKNSILEHLE